MSQLPLTKIGFYNPRRLTDQEIEANFIARNALFKFIFEKISSHSQDVIPQHIIIIGQRGMGKTLLLYRLGVELRKSPNNKKFIPLNYPEEQYNIDRLSKFWLNSLKALIDALDTENQTDLADQLENELEELNTETRSNASDMYQIFQSWINKIDRCPVLLVDNLNLIFNNISTDEQHKLRANLMTKSAPILIGASAVTIQDTIEYGAPFYDAFLIQKLYKIKLEESIKILKNLGRLTGKIKENEIAERLTKNKGRIATLHQLTGGTPRTLSMLFPLISDGFSEDIQTDLHAIMDMITPLYKARFEELSTQMQIVLDAIALNWDPASIEQLRKITQLTNAQLSPQLKRLVDVGWLNKLKSNKSKGDLYEISERFFNVWYLMRRSNRRQQRDLHCLSRFLEMYYGEDILRIAALRSKLPTSTEEGAFIDLAIAGIIKDEKLSKDLSDKSYEKLLEVAKKDSRVLSKYSIPEEKLNDEVSKLLKLLVEQLIRTTDKNTNKVIEISNDFIQLIKFHKNYEETIHALIENLIIFSKDLITVKLFKECERLLIELLKFCKLLDEKYIQEYSDDVRYVLGEVYGLSNRFKKAIDSYLKIKSTNVKSAQYWSRLGASYQDNGDFEDAKEAYLKSLQLNPLEYKVYYLLGEMCFEDLLDYETAEKAYLGAIKLNPTVDIIWLNLGVIYKNSDKLIEAENAFKSILKIDKKNYLAFLSLAFLYLVDLNKLDKSIQAHVNFLKYKPKEIKANDMNVLISRYNLFFLHIHLSKEIDKAKSQLDIIPTDSSLKVQRFLCKAILSYSDQNAGIAKDHIIQATKKVFSGDYKYHWYMVGVIIKNQNFGQHYLEVLKETGFNKEWKPYYVAMKALLSKEPELYLNTAAKEVRKPAAEILDWMVKFEAAQSK